MENSNKPAFGYGFTTAHGNAHVEENGLTKREYFAAMAMQGLLARPVNLNIEMNVIQSIQIADELLKQLGNGQ